MEYSIYKDDDVVITVERIKQILKNLDVELTEKIVKSPIQSKYMPYSMRVKLFGIESIGTNGKGTSIENCRASAYSEFMERLQNQQGIITSFTPLDAIKNFHKNILSEYYTKEFLDFFYTNYLKEEDETYIPFYNYTKDKLVYLPNKLEKEINGSNGMCAGNTPEEALVQGFSEICERYAMKEVILNEVQMPNIPKDIYEKYDNIKGMIEYFEQFGFSIKIKDASLGKGLPVICTVFENKKQNIFTFNFGSQPSLPVAIERTLTEFAQGSNYIDKEFWNLRCRYNNKINFKRWKKYLYFRCFLCSVYLENADPIHKIFINNNSNYKFDRLSFIDENKKFTNKELLKFLIGKIQNITNNEIYIRDVSFLGIPSFCIYIPTISDVKDFFVLKENLNFSLWLNYIEDKFKYHKKIDSLIDAAIFQMTVHTSQNISALACEYILLLCYIVKKDIQNIIFYSQLLLNMEEKPVSNKLIEIINKYYTLKANNLKEEKLDEKIEKEFKKEDIDYFKKFIFYLNFERIKKIISNNNKKHFERVYKRVQTPEMKELNYKMKNLREKLIKRYQNNIPNQMKLRKVFDFNK